MTKEEAYNKFLAGMSVTRMMIGNGIADYSEVNAIELVGKLISERKHPYDKQSPHEVSTSIAIAELLSYINDITDTREHVGQQVHKAVEEWLAQHEKPTIPPIDQLLAYGQINQREGYEGREDFVAPKRKPKIVQMLSVNHPGYGPCLYTLDEKGRMYTRTEVYCEPAKWFEIEGPDTEVKP